MASFQTSKFAYLQLDGSDIVEVFAKQPNGQLIDWPEAPVVAIVNEKNVPLKRIAEDYENE